MSYDYSENILVQESAGHLLQNELGWEAEYGIEEMCADSWNWQKNNPDGYHTVK